MTLTGIIPAAGEGSRLGGLTDDRPKPLVEVAGRPLIRHAIETLSSLGVDEVVVVIGYRGEAIVEHLGDGAAGVPLTYVHQRERHGLAHAIELAMEITTGPAVVHNADNIFERPPTGAIEPVTNGPADGTVVVEEVSRAAAGEAGVVEVEDERITRLVEQPADPPSTTATTGVYVLPAAVAHACSLVRPGPTGERELTAAVDLLVRAGYDIRAIPVDGWRSNVNTPADLERAERRLSDATR